MWTNAEPLPLKVGAYYNIRVSAINGAGLTGVHDTSGVIVDPTPPEVRMLCKMIESYKTLTNKGRSPDEFKTIYYILTIMDILNVKVSMS